MEELRRRLRNTFDIDHVDLEEVMNVLEDYQSNPADWIKYTDFEENTLVSLFFFSSYEHIYYFGYRSGNLPLLKRSKILRLSAQIKYIRVKNAKMALEG